MSDEVFISIDRLAGRVGLPAAWLKREAEAGRLPYVRAGRRLMFNVEAVRQSLLQRAAGSREAVPA